MVMYSSITVYENENKHCFPKDMLNITVGEVAIATGGAASRYGSDLPKCGSTFAK
jgi:hypothetical protein